MDEDEKDLLTSYQDLALKYALLVERSGKLTYLVGFMYSILRGIQHNEVGLDQLNEVFKEIEPKIKEVAYPRTQSA